MKHTQFSRVVAITNGTKWRTLRDIELECYLKFGVRDSQAAISARLRDNIKMNFVGLKKETLIKRIKNKNCWFYRLVSK